MKSNFKDLFKGDFFKLLLNTLLVGILITCNVIVGKTFNFIGDMNMSVAPIAFVLTYLIANVISYKYGKYEAYKTVILGFITQIISTLIILLLGLIPANDNSFQEAYDKILGFNWIAVIASLIAYLCSEFFNIIVFNKLYNNTKNKILKGVWNVLGNLTGNMLDTIVFNFIFFYIGLNYSIVDVLYMMLTTFLLRSVIILIYSPLFYLLTLRRIKNG